MPKKQNGRSGKKIDLTLGAPSRIEIGKFTTYPGCRDLAQVVFRAKKAFNFEESVSFGIQSLSGNLVEILSGDLDTFWNHDFMSFRMGLKII